jgi:hypothetical protein
MSSMVLGDTTLESLTPSVNAPLKNIGAHQIKNHKLLVIYAMY